jgi:hypothetical protein
MTLRIDIDPQTQDRLRKEAERNGVEIGEYARKLIERHLPPELPQSPAKSLHDLFAQWSAEDATDDPEEIAARERDLEELKRNLNEWHSSDRKLFP